MEWVFAGGGKDERQTKIVHGRPSAVWRMLTVVTDSRVARECRGGGACGSRAEVAGPRRCFGGWFCMGGGGVLTRVGADRLNRGARRRFRGSVKRLLAEVQRETRRRLNPVR